MARNMPSASWRKSTYSSGGASNCVEVGHAARAVKVRDTKEQHLGTGRTVLSVPAPAWGNFTRSLR